MAIRKNGLKNNSKLGIICHYGFNSVELQLRLTSVRLLLERFKRERDCYGTLSIRRYLWRLKGEERMITRFHRYLHAFRHARWLRARSMLCNDNGFSLSRVRKRRSLKFIAARYEAVATRSMTLLRQKALTSSSKATFISVSFRKHTVDPLSIPFCQQCSTTERKSGRYLNEETSDRVVATRD